MAKILISLILTSLVALISGQCTDDKALQYFKRSVYDFTVQLSSKIYLETDGHFIASGLSPWALISALSLGATEETLEQIIKVLNMHPNACFKEKIFKIIRKVISDSDPVLKRSANIFLDQKRNVNENFKLDVNKAGVCDIKAFPFNEVAYTVDFINDHVSKATHEAINETVTLSDIARPYIMLVDALSFKGAWKLPFPIDHTETSAFYDHNGNRIGNINLMYVRGKFSIIPEWTYAEILEMPYADHRFSMLLFLPIKGYSVKTVLENLKLISLRTIFALFENQGKTTVNVQIPRFKITSDIKNWKKLLVDMGLKKMFSYGGRFVNVASFPLYVTNFIQKADIEVTEGSTEPAAVDTASIDSMKYPEQFMAKQPFLFMIVDKETELPLLTGAYSKPSLFTPLRKENGFDSRVISVYACVCIFIMIILLTISGIFLCIYTYLNK